MFGPDVQRTTKGKHPPTELDPYYSCIHLVLSREVPLVSDV